MSKARIGSFDVSEVLCQHIDQLYSQMEVLRSIIHQGSPFCKALKTKQGQNLINFLTDAQKSKTVKISESNSKFVKEYIPQLQNAIKILSYMFEWYETAKKQLLSMDSHSIGLDIRWNNVFTVQYCKLFVTIIKVVLFLHFHPPSRIVALMSSIFPDLTKIPVYGGIRSLIRFTNQSTASPFDFLSEEFGVLSIRLSQFCANIGPFLVQVFGIWPIVNWQSFSVFNRSETAPDSTLPSYHHMILINLELMKETVSFFCIIFNEFITLNKQFSSIMTTILSDCNSIFLSRTYKISIQSIFQAYEKTGKKINPLLLSIISDDNTNKKKISHKQRMLHITSLLRDIIDIASYDASYLPKFMYNILPLASFACYEINVAFSEETISKTAAKLVSVLVDLSVLFSKFQNTISRFFLFNLATQDSNYLNQMLHQYSSSQETWQNELISKVIDLSEQLQTLDLEQYDKGSRYDVTPFIYSSGRILYQFNEVRTKQKAAFLNSLFEHVTTIVFHSKLMLKPLDTFLQSCPIHQLWKHSDTINKYILQKKGGIQIYSRFITLCSFFNCDQICLTNIPTVRSVLNKYMQSWRGDLIQSLRSTVSELLTSNKPIISIVNQNRFSQLFDPDPYVKYHLEHIEATDSTKEVFSDAELREPIWQLKEFMDNIPNSITLIGVQDPINFSEYFAHHLTTNLGSLLFKNSVADAPMVDAAFSAATQLLWPLYVLLNVSYPLRMIEFRFENTTTESHSFLELISKLRNAKENELTNDPSITFLKVFENRLIQFIKEDYKKSLYPPYGHCFFNYLQNDYKVDDFISEQGFKYFISSLGIHSSFSLDYILIVEITNIMLNIFNIYQSLSNDISTWYSDFRNNGQLWTKSSQNAQIHTAADLIVKLGIVLMIRKLLRKSMNEMIEQNIPGLIKLLNSSVLRLTSDRIGLKEDIIIEIALNKNDFKVIEIILNEKQITKCSDPIQFFFFLSLLNMNNHWNDAKFSPGNEMISYNLHLIPAAINAFIHLLKMFCSSNDSKIIGTAMQFYFSVYRRIITFKMNTVQEMSHESVNAMIILTDLFPKYINDLEYGRIGSNFPYSVITEAYREVEIKTREIEMQREKNLKMEKGKKKGKENEAKK